MSWTDISEEERMAIMSEIDLPKLQLCPNVTEFEVVRGRLHMESYLSLSVEALTKDESIIEKALLRGSTIRRNFNPDDYLAKGYQGAIAERQTDITF